MMLMICLVGGWMSLGSGARERYDKIEAGVTTEAQVDTLFGPPFGIGTHEPTPVMRNRLGIPDQPDGQPVILMVKEWYYDDENIFEVYFDAQGIVVDKGGPAVAPPRSAIRRWWREKVKPLLFE
jgi:hypothetical protein